MLKAQEEYIKVESKDHTIIKSDMFIFLGVYFFLRAVLNIFRN